MSLAAKPLCSSICDMTSARPSSLDLHALSKSLSSLSSEEILDIGIQNILGKFQQKESSVDRPSGPKQAEVKAIRAGGPAGRGGGPSPAIDQDVDILQLLGIAPSAPPSQAQVRETMAIVNLGHHYLRSEYFCNSHDILRRSARY